jgi:hypothetical protein
MRRTLNPNITRISRRRNRRHQNTTEGKQQRCQQCIKPQITRPA